MIERIFAEFSFFWRDFVRVEFLQRGKRGDTESAIQRILKKEKEEKESTGVRKKNEERHKNLSTFLTEQIGLSFTCNCVNLGELLRAFKK